MSARPQSSTSRIMTIFVFVVIGTIAWFIAPLFLPMYRWLHIDFAEIATQAQSNGYKLTAGQVGTKYKLEFAYDPRHESDPRPFVLLRMNPPYYDIVPDDDWSVDEEGLLLRCMIIGDRAGTPPSHLILGTGHYKDRFFRAEGWRLPPKALGLSTGDRPVIVYDSTTLEKMTVGESQNLSTSMRVPELYTPDDDGWYPPEGDESQE